MTRRWLVAAAVAVVTGGWVAYAYLPTDSIRRKSIKERWS